MVKSSAPSHLAVGNIAGFHVFFSRFISTVYVERRKDLENSYFEEAKCTFERSGPRVLAVDHVSNVGSHVLCCS